MSKALVRAERRAGAGGLVSADELAARRIAFAAEMKENGLTAKSGGKFIHIDAPGAFLIAEFIDQEERKGTGKYKALELHLTLKIVKGVSVNKDGELCEIAPGDYDYRADGNIPAYIERTNPVKGTIMAFYFVEKRVFARGTAEYKKWNKGVKSYDIFDKANAGGTK